jgi:hypothetical protein
MVGLSPIVAKKQHRGPCLTYLINMPRTAEKAYHDLMGRFYVPSSGWGRRLKLAKQLTGDVALQAPLDVADGLALSEATLDVILGGAVLSHSDQHDGVERAVELSISGPVQSVPGDGPRRCLDGCGTAELGESSLGTDASVIGPGGDDLSGHDRADSELAEQLGGEPTDQAAAAGPDRLCGLCTLCYHR